MLGDLESSHSIVTEPVPRFAPPAGVVNFGYASTAAGESATAKKRLEDRMAAGNKSLQRFGIAVVVAWGFRGWSRARAVHEFRILRVREALKRV